MTPWIIALGLIALAALVWAVARRRPKPPARPRPISLALALIFGAIFDPPQRHVVEAKQAKRDAPPRPGDPPSAEA
jgi:hypothetical protein